MSFYSGLKTIIKKYFISGLLVTVPLIITYLVLRFLFNTLDGLLNPIIRDLLGYRIPGLGAFVTILLILLAGVIATNFMGHRLFRLGDRFLGRTPLVRVIYIAAKQLAEAVLNPDMPAFSEVALIEFPRPGIFAVGFLSGRSSLRSDATGAESRYRLVFIPSTPTPFTGWVVFVPEKDIRVVNLTVEEAIKMVVSGGIVAPPSVVINERYHGPEVTDAAG